MDKFSRIIVKSTLLVLSLLLGLFIPPVSLAQFEGNPLSQAVDNTAYDFFSEEPAFFRQTTVSNVGGDAAQSGSIGDNEFTVLLVAVQGGPTVSFDWKVSCELNWDVFLFSVLNSNFEPIDIGDFISGEEDWQRRTFVIPEGIYLLTWWYVKDGDISAGADAGWVDNVVITAPTNPIPTNPIPNIAPILQLLLQNS